MKRVAMSRNHGKTEDAYNYKSFKNIRLILEKLEGYNSLIVILIIRNWDL